MSESKVPQTPRNKVVGRRIRAFVLKPGSKDVYIRNPRLAEKRETEKLIPDREAMERVEREHPNKPAHEKYRLAQADTLLRLAKPENLEELHRMAEAGTLGDLIQRTQSEAGRKP